jgi:serpin B
MAQLKHEFVSMSIALTFLLAMFHRLSMIVLLPMKMDGLRELETSITDEKLNQWLMAMKANRVELSLPKFRFDSAFKLGDTLKTMGMQDAFTPGKADFSGIAGPEELFISEVIHKAHVDVSEEGTEAAAATAVVMRAGAAMAPLQNVVFKADHPFLFLIRHNESGTILFIGRVVNPK